jgi:hypothetical protein
MSVGVAWLNVNQLAAANVVAHRRRKKARLTLKAWLHPQLRGWLYQWRIIRNGRLCSWRRSSSMSGGIINRRRTGVMSVVASVIIDGYSEAIFGVIYHS